MLTGPIIPNAAANEQINGIFTQQLLNLSMNRFFQMAIGL